MNESKSVDAQTQGFIDGKRRIAKAIAFAASLGSAIKDMGDQGAPEGPMYAACVARGYTLEEFQGAMRTLETTGLIRRTGHVAYWIGRK